MNTLLFYSSSIFWGMQTDIMFNKRHCLNNQTFSLSGILPCVSTRLESDWKGRAGSFKWRAHCSLLDFWVAPWRAFTPYLLEVVLTLVKESQVLLKTHSNDYSHRKLWKWDNSIDFRKEKKIKRPLCTLISVMPWSLVMSKINKRFLLLLFWIIWYLLLWFLWSKWLYCFLLIQQGEERMVPFWNLSFMTVWEMQECHQLWTVF